MKFAGSRHAAGERLPEEASAHARHHPSTCLVTARYLHHHLLPQRVNQHREHELGVAGYQRAWPGATGIPTQERQHHTHCTR
jgi:hypothetical protein